MDPAKRPVSPHLQIYGWYLTMAMSIGHRVTGAALAAGLVLFTWWLAALATGPESFAFVQGLAASLIGLLVLIGFSAALFYHLCNGIRHLVWDFGYGYDKDVARLSGFVTLAAAAVLTVLLWVTVLFAAG